VLQESSEEIRRLKKRLTQEELKVKMQARNILVYEDIIRELEQNFAEQTQKVRQELKTKLFTDNKYKEMYSNYEKKQKVQMEVLMQLQKNHPLLFTTCPQLRTLIRMNAIGNQTKAENFQKMLEQLAPKNGTIIESNKKYTAVYDKEVLKFIYPPQDLNAKILPKTRCIALFHTGSIPDHEQIQNYYKIFRELFFENNETEKPKKEEKQNKNAEVIEQLQPEMEIETQPAEEEVENDTQSENEPQSETQSENSNE